MIKVLKTDLFRLFRSKAFYAYPIVLAALIIFEMILSVQISSKDKDVYQVAGGEIIRDYKPDEISEGGRSIEPDYFNNTNEPMNITVDAEDGVETHFTLNPGDAFFAGDGGMEDRHLIISLPIVFGALGDGFMMLFIGIALVVFSTSETRNGFVKNAVGCVLDRRFMPASKMIIGVIILFIYLVENIILRGISILLNYILSGKSIWIRHLPEGDIGRFWGYLIGCLIVHLAIIALLVMIHELSFSRSIGIVFSVVFSIGFIETLIDGVVYLLQYFFHILEEFDIKKYMLMENIISGYNSDKYHPEILPFMALLYLVLGVLLAMVITRKKDVR